MIQATLGQAGPHIELVYRQGHPGGSLRSVRFSARLHDQNRHVQGAIVSEIDQNMIRQFVTQTTRREQTSSWHPAIQEFAVLSQTG